MVKIKIKGIYAQTTEDFEELINRRVLDGWTPKFESMCVVSSGFGTRFYILLTRDNEVTEVELVD